jgi:hypothetical protein
MDFLPEWPANEVGWEGYPDDLFMPVRYAHRNFQDNGHDIGDDNGVVTFPYQRLAAHHALLSPKSAQRIEFIMRQSGAYCAVSNDALGTDLHSAALHGGL